MQLLNDQTKSANQHSLKSERKSERMKSMKKLISIILAVAVIFALNITAFAGGFITDESATPVQKQILLTRRLLMTTPS